METSRKHKVKKCSKDKLKSKKIKANDVSLLILNDDCLLRIFRYMNILELTNVEQTCTRLRNIACLCYSTMKTLELSGLDLSFACASKIILKLGRYSTSLHSLNFDRILKPSEHNKEYVHYNNFIDTLLDNCKNIKSLKLTHCDVGCEWKPFFDVLQHLESLSLHATHLRNSNYLGRVTTLKQFEIRGRNSFELAKFNDFLANNGNLERLTLDECENLSKGLRFDILGNLRLQSLSVEVYEENVKQIDYKTADDMDEMEKPWRTLKKLKITQRNKNSNLNSFLKKITENSALEKLELLKFHIDKNTFAVLKAMKLESFYLYPKFKDDVTTMCRMLVDALPNLKHLTLVFFDLNRDLDLSDHDMLFLIERLKQLESLDLHHCQSDCQFGCDYIVCPFRCKLRDLIKNINEIFHQDTDRPKLRLVLPRHVSKSFFDSKLKTQKKYRQILTNRVSFIKCGDLDDPFMDSSGLLQSFFSELIGDDSNDDGEDDSNDDDEDDSNDDVDSESNSESVESDNDPDDLESDDDQEVD